MSPATARFVCFIGIFILMSSGKDGWGWLLFIALFIDV
jgi:hypothetical protein